MRLRVTLSIAPPPFRVMASCYQDLQACALLTALKRVGGACFQLGNDVA